MHPYTRELLVDPEMLQLYSILAWFILSLGALLLLSVAYMYYQEWRYRRIIRDKYKDVTIRNTGQIIPYLRPEERRKPPCAQFFGRENGIPIETTAEPEESYLNTFELRHWKEQNKKKSTKKTKSEAKKRSLSLFIAKMKQKVINFDSLLFLDDKYR